MGYSNRNTLANTTYRCAPDVVLNGMGVLTYAFEVFSANTTIDGCEITGYVSNTEAVVSFRNQSYAQNVGRNTWSSFGKVINNNIHNNSGGGIDLGGHNHQALDNDVNFNGRYGIAGGGGNNLLIQGNHVEGNNTRNFDGRDEAGGGKVTTATNVQWINNTYLHNNGPEIWADIDVDEILVEGNTVIATWTAVMLETSYRATVRNNTLTTNGCDDPRAGSFPDNEWCNVIFVYNSGDNVQESLIHNNILTGQYVQQSQMVQLLEIWFFFQDRFVDDNPNGDLYGSGKWQVFENNLALGQWQFDCEPEGGLNQAECNAIEVDIEVTG